MSRRESGHERKERNLYKSGQPRLTITNPPIISVAAPMKIAVSNGVMIQLLRMASPRLDGFERACASRRIVEICARLPD
jgi:hypothetical protein